MSLRVAYIVNQYPKVSHTFIRREIIALERQGFEIMRIALRGWDATLVDVEDLDELSKTHYVLKQSVPSLSFAVFKAALWNPIRFLSALFLAIRMGHNAERSWPYHLIYLAEACCILPWLKGFGATHVHAHFGNNSAEIAMFVYALGGPKYSFTIHGQDELHFGGLSTKISYAAFTVAISSFGRSQIMYLVEHTLWSKIKVVHCGLETNFHNITPVSAPAAPRFVCVGRLSAEKGQLLLIEAAFQLSRIGIRLELVLVGDGELRQEFESKISDYGLGEQIRITGWLSSNEVREEILSARAMVHPSFSEGLPVVIMEAMALRRPVLSTYIAGIPELVLHGETGWLFPAGSLDDLIAAIKDCLMLTGAELDRMGEKGHNRILERHHIDKEAAKLGLLFREVINKKDISNVS